MPEYAELPHSLHRKTSIIGRLTKPRVDALAFTVDSNHRLHSGTFLHEVYLVDVDGIHPQIAFGIFNAPKHHSKSIEESSSY